MVNSTPVITLPWKNTCAMLLNRPSSTVEVVTMPSTMAAALGRPAVGSNGSIAIGQSRRVRGQKA
jgi:hypothetical protein